MTDGIHLIGFQTLFFDMMGRQTQRPSGDPSFFHHPFSIPCRPIDYSSSS
ncbi:hypothetical protein HQ520_06390 [bacterium]|nr:hypothetical protein [bacterium]